MTGIGGGDVARGIARGDRSRDITVRCQHRTGNIHAPGFTIGIHRRLVRFRADFDGNRIARFNFITYLTGHRNRLARFTGVNHVIAGDIVDRYRCGWCNGIDTVSVAGVGGSHVTYRITGGDGRRDVAVRGQYSTGNIHAPGFTIGIHRRLVGLGADFNGNRITRFNVVVDFTGHGYGLAGLGRIDHVIRRDVIN
ncbi:hypothetical protein IW00_05425 [Pectobacterium brasiliense]|nr:hypothetical protein IW00_05425 [Pectobacterium brasiliense]